MIGPKTLVAVRDRRSKQRNDEFRTERPSLLFLLAIIIIITGPQLNRALKLCASIVHWSLSFLNQYCSSCFRCHDEGDTSESRYPSTQLVQTDLLDRYNALVDSGSVEWDEGQVRTVRKVREFVTIFCNVLIFLLVAQKAQQRPPQLYSSAKLVPFPSLMSHFVIPRYI